mmetsp:Transcript_23149/g.50307  ORF Transcript_23149/g.50307 Transcript_23149/m.50307 type:complete len:268 (-) Transcript_23149:113-916(-)
MAAAIFAARLASFSALRRFFSSFSAFRLAFSAFRLAFSSSSASTSSPAAAEASTSEPPASSFNLDASSICFSSLDFLDFFFSFLSFFFFFLPPPLPNLFFCPASSMHSPYVANASSLFMVNVVIGKSARMALLAAVSNTFSNASVSSSLPPSPESGRVTQQAVPVFFPRGMENFPDGYPSLMNEGCISDGVVSTSSSAAGPPSLLAESSDGGEPPPIGQPRVPEITARSTMKEVDTSGGGVGWTAALRAFFFLPSSGFAAAASLMMI